MVGACGNESCHTLGRLGARASWFLSKFAITPSNFFSSLCEVHMTCETSLKHCDYNCNAKVGNRIGQPLPTSHSSCILFLSIEYINPLTMNVMRIIFVSSPHQNHMLVASYEHGSLLSFIFPILHMMIKKYKIHIQRLYEKMKVMIRFMLALTGNGHLNWGRL